MSTHENCGGMDWIEYQEALLQERARSDTFWDMIDAQRHGGLTVVLVKQNRTGEGEISVISGADVLSYLPIAEAERTIAQLAHVSYKLGFATAINRLQRTDSSEPRATPCLVLAECGCLLLYFLIDPAWQMISPTMWDPGRPTPEA